MPLPSYQLKPIFNQNNGTRYIWTDERKMIEMISSDYHWGLQTHRQYPAPLESLDLSPVAYSIYRGSW